MNKRVEANKIVRSNICKALVTLMREKDYDKITVTDIIRKAGVARISYYRNFESKEDVLKEYIASVMENFYRQQGDKENFDSYDKVLKSFICFKRYREPFALLIKAGLSELLLNVLSSISSCSSDNNGKKVDIFYHTAYIGALFNIIRLWLSGGCKESPEEIAKIFYDIWHEKNFRLETCK